MNRRTTLSLPLQVLSWAGAACEVRDMTVAPLQFVGEAESSAGGSIDNDTNLPQRSP